MEHHDSQSRDDNEADNDKRSSPSPSSPISKPPCIVFHTAQPGQGRERVRFEGDLQRSWEESKGRWEGPFHAGDSPRGVHVSIYIYIYSSSSFSLPLSSFLRFVSGQRTRNRAKVASLVVFLGTKVNINFCLKVKKKKKKKKRFGNSTSSNSLRINRDLEQSGWERGEVD